MRSANRLGDNFRIAFTFFIYTTQSGLQRDITRAIALCKQRPTPINLFDYSNIPSNVKQDDWTRWRRAQNTSSTYTLHIQSSAKEEYCLDMALRELVHKDRGQDKSS